ncbi:hypothetical protein [Roseomonas sp. KE0001]|uniref:hypothetical protein n=1 Tax=unclassified Roseomonas TaxID=2617492 RepID=UPI0018E006B3|nr:hypothetical protein [Roseomonas sp. KE0001]MBI0434900.1 hypothetical protein [Roseomonas sp. KE0001]
MRPFRLAAVSLEAERVVLGLQAKRYVWRALFGMIAAVFACAALVMLHVVAWLALPLEWTPLARAGTLLGADLVLVLVLGLLAMRDAPSRAEIEARILRDNAIAQTRASLGVVPLLGGIARSSGMMGLLFGLFRRRR